jgi:hypothetical protein
MSRPTPAPPVRARIPAEPDREDKIMFDLTGRQLVILGTAGLGLWALWAATARLLPGPVFIGIAVPVAAIAFILAVGRREGVPLSSWLLAAWRARRQPARLVPALGDIEAAPDWVGPAAHDGATPPGPLELPAAGVTAAGLVDLGDDGTAALVGCSTVNYHLRTTDEQHALVAGFARWLNSLDAPVQIVVSSRPIDLTILAERIDAHAAGLPHPALERAARAHADFLARLGAERELLHRTVTVVVRDRRGPDHTLHRARETARALSACEVSAEVLDADATAAALAAAINPSGLLPPAGLAPSNAVISARIPVEEF